MELLILCFKIFFVRIIEVSLGTFRTMETVKGKTKEATIIGFFELLVWFLIVKEALNTTSNSIFIAISYFSFLYFLLLVIHQVYTQVFHITCPM